MTATQRPHHLRPRKIPRQPRARETRARILASAAEAFETHGYAHGTTNRIAEGAGLSVGSLYQYFPNKDAILVELVDDHIDAGVVAVTDAVTRAEARSADARPGLDDLIGCVVEAMVALHGTNRRLHRVLFEEAPRPPEQLARLRSIEQMLTERMAEMIAGHPEIPGGRDLDVATRLVVETIESLVHRVATDEQSKIDDAALTAEITLLVVAYLRTAPST